MYIDQDSRLSYFLHRIPETTRQAQVQTPHLSYPHMVVRATTHRQTIFQYLQRYGTSCFVSRFLFFPFPLSFVYIIFLSPDLIAAVFPSLIYSSVLFSSLALLLVSDPFHSFLFLPSPLSLFLSHFLILLLLIKTI